MIIVKLIGGLGNQMYQYSLGRHLAERNGTSLKLDIGGFETYRLHKYSLSHFNIQENIATPAEIAKLKGRRRSVVRRGIDRLLARASIPPSYVRERHFHFDPTILELPDNVYLEGYWQSERYFADIADIIRLELTVKSPQEGRDREVAEQIAAVDAVSLHIRRGDYVTDPVTARKHGVCSLDYYPRAAKFIAERVDRPRFFIFSDDPVWARDNLKLPHPMTFVDHNGPDRACEDLRLISQCRHHVIANSSFSWWGAWLCEGRDKIVCAPRQWFAEDVQARRKMDDLLPDGWVRL